MVRSLNELVYDVLEQYRATSKTTDSLDERQVASWIQHLRAEFIKQRLEETLRNIDEHWVQDLGHVEMELVDSSIYSDIDSGKTILRSVKDIPRTIQTRFGVGTFTRVGPADRLGKKYNLVSYERALASGNGKFNSKDIYAFLDGKRLCLISNANLHKLVQYIHVKGVFQNPAEAYTFKTGLDYDWDLEYPISESLVNAITTTIKERNFKFVLLPLEDKVTDGTDTLVNANVKR
jgi:hypothetical protein